MGRSADALSEKQVATLEWIRDGCPIVDQETEVSRKISAASLKSRGRDHLERTIVARLLRTAPRRRASPAVEDTPEGDPWQRHLRRLNR